MTHADKTPDLAHLAFRRRWLAARLEAGALDAAEEAEVLKALEALDLRIAATPCSDVGDLCIKIERLAALIWPSDEPMPEDCPEHVMLASVLRGARALAGE